ncbi:hypothetical protein VPNG_09581 [Cytospora leucostoma]|uniref:Large ribosomal subunit protein bL27m n=1 Tax=Cytospora leucostoma TaxID=1230097 RepID=A0A423VN33_9PEZI|nr:hypothetical protein VPNG_09581 [Cytospora leucostoma]
MRLVQLQRPLQAAAIARSCRPTLSTFTLPIRPSIQAPSSTPAAGNAAVEGRRFASVKSQGAYRIPNKKTLPKKLGAKKSGDQYVVTGNIIFKQRGTMWHPGENALKGRDHTIHAAVSGYVKYYRDPKLHPTRQYIGVAFNREDTLPYPKDEPRRRKLGMVAVTRKVHDKKDNISASGIPRRVVRKGGLYDVEALEQQLWSREKARELAEARGETTTTGGEASSTSDADPAQAAAGEAAASEGEVAATPITSAESGDAEPGKGRKKHSRAEQREFVHPLAFIQKRWLERRRTRTLHLNPRNYSYAESNAAIGRLVSRTMELVRQEKEKERIAEEAKRARMLAKQRAKGQGRAEGKKVEGKKVEGKEGEKAEKAGEKKADA